MVFDRKSEPYRQAMLISRLLLLNYYPDINSGRNHVLALMFDMNLLWEKFVYVSLRKFFKEGTVEQQLSKPYWKLGQAIAISLRPDVVLISDETRYVLDTKWKLPNNNKPGTGDLQQMYAYTKYFNSDHTLLCYPGNEDSFVSGFFYNEERKEVNGYPCSVIRIAFDPKDPIGRWQERISEQVLKSITQENQQIESPN